MEAWQKGCPIPEMQNIAKNKQNVAKKLSASLYSLLKPSFVLHYFDVNLRVNIGTNMYRRIFLALRELLIDEFLNRSFVYRKMKRKKFR